MVGRVHLPSSGSNAHGRLSRRLRAAQPSGSTLARNHRMFETIIGIYFRYGDGDVRLAVCMTVVLHSDPFPQYNLVR